MASPKPAWTLDDSDDEWVLPRWNAQQVPPAPVAEPASVPRGAPNRSPRAPEPPRTAVDSASRHVFAIAAPQGIIGGLALIASLIASNRTLPLAVVTVLILQVIGYAATRSEEPPALR